MEARLSELATQNALAASFGRIADRVQAECRQDGQPDAAELKVARPRELERGLLVERPDEESGGDQQAT